MAGGICGENAAMKLASAGLLLLVICWLLPSPKKHVSPVPLAYSSPQSGAQMYRDCCAVCHGPAGKGDGPAGQFLKVAPPDLSKLARHNGGKYPAGRVARTLRYGTRSQADGSAAMPHWEPLFRSHYPQEADLRIANLTKYVESLQQK